MTSNAAPISTPPEKKIEAVQGYSQLIEGCSQCCCVFVIGPLTTIGMLATGIIGILGVVGIVSVATMSTTLVVSSALLLTSSLLLYSQSSTRHEKTAGAVGVLAGLTFMILGSFAAAHIITSFAVGWVCIGGSIAIVGGSIVYYRNLLRTK